MAEERRPRGRASRKATIAAEVILFGLGFAAMWSVSTRHDGTATDEPESVGWDGAAAPEAESPSRERRPDQASAAAAAVSYATVSQRWLYFTDAQITDAVEAIAAPEAVDELAADTIAEVTAARTALSGSPGPVWWLVRPMAWKVEALRADEATVEVWTVTVLSAEEVAAPQTEWVTVTVDLEWIDGIWKLDALRDTPGPTPMPGPGDAPWDAIPFDDALEGFTRIDGDLAS